MTVKNQIGYSNIFSVIISGCVIMNFKELDALIKSGAKEITLTEDVVLEDDEKEIFKEGIEIDTSALIINGNNHVINANNQTRIFLVLNGNIFLNYINFENGETESIGGAMFADNGTVLHVRNCHFRNNTGYRYGGALFSIKGSILDVSHCTFKNNGSKGDGGAIQSEGQLYLKHCKFFNNYARNVLRPFHPHHGGAVCTYGVCKIEDCLFDSNDSNIATSIYGKDADVILKNSLFKNDNDCGQIYGDFSNFKIIGCNFIDDLECNVGFYYGEHVVENCKNCKISEFNLNKTIKNSEGIVKLNSDTLIMEVCEVINDNLVIDGNNHQVLTFGESDTFDVKSRNVILKNMIFSSHVRIRNECSLTIENCIFKSFNDEIIINNGDLALKNCKFFSDFIITNDGEVTIIENGEKEVLTEKIVKLIEKMRI